MKSKFLILASCLFYMQLNIIANPLVIINTTDKIELHVSLKSGNQTAKLASKEKFTHEMDHDRLVYLKWQEYSENDRAWHDYKIDVKTQIPSFYRNGGIIVIVKNGIFLYDEKNGDVKRGTA